MVPRGTGPGVPMPWFYRVFSENDEMVSISGVIVVSILHFLTHFSKPSLYHGQKSQKCQKCQKTEKGVSCGVTSGVSSGVHCGGFSDILTKNPYPIPEANTFMTF